MAYIRPGIDRLALCQHEETRMMLDHKHSLGRLQLRQATEDDADFLFELFSVIKTEELNAWHWDLIVREQVLTMQFRAHQQHHDSQGNNLHYVVCLADTPIGRLILKRDDEVLLLADIALLKEWRGQGVGTALLRHVQSEAAAEKKPLRLSVIQGSPAARFYQRLGFEVVSKTDTHEQMQWVSCDD